MVLNVLRSTYQANAERRGKDNIDFHLLVYKFDAAKPWQHFKEGRPVASSVERGKRKLNSNKLTSETISDSADGSARL